MLYYLAVLLLIKKMEFFLPQIIKCDSLYDHKTNLKPKPINQDKE